MLSCSARKILLLFLLTCPAQFFAEIPENSGRQCYGSDGVSVIKAVPVKLDSFDKIGFSIDIMEIEENASGGLSLEFYKNNGNFCYLNSLSAGPRLGEYLSILFCGGFGFQTNFYSNFSLEGKIGTGLLFSFKKFTVKTQFDYNSIFGSSLNIGFGHSYKIGY